MGTSARTRAFGVLIGLTLCAAPASSAQDASSAQKEFQVGNQLMQQRQYLAALPHYKTALAANPGDPALLYNAGLAAFLGKKYADAVPFWTQFVGKSPDDWRVHAKLVQTYQALGDMKARDQARQSLFALRKGGTVKDLNAQEMYCREQFEAAGKPVFAFEYFDLKGEFALRYKFVAVDPATDAETSHIALESDVGDNEIARGMGELKPGERVWTLDGYYYDTKKRLQTQRLFRFFQSEPTYDETRRQVVQIMQGQVKSLGASERPLKKRPGDKR